MDDEGLFEQLFKMLQTPGSVNWQLAREVTKSLAGTPSPIEPGVAEEYQELAHVADVRISQFATLPSSAAFELNPTDRATWAAENQQAFRVLIEPLGDKLSNMNPGEIPGLGDMGGMSAMLAPLGPALIGLQAGTMVGFMSHRALGQFDTGIPAMDHDRPYVIVPNLDDFAIDHGIDHRQVRLWGALHEVAFQRIMAVEWVRGRFVNLVQAFYETVEVDTSDLMGRLGSMNDPSEIERMLDQGGEDPTAGLIRATSDPAALANIQAFTAFVDGFADRLVRLAGKDLLPTIDRIEAAYNLRRTEPDQTEQFLQQMAGLKLDRSLATTAAEFCDAVVERWGEETLATVWDEPENMPMLGELSDPIGWAARVVLDDTAFDDMLGIDPDDLDVGDDSGHEPA